MDLQLQRPRRFGIFLPGDNSTLPLEKEHRSPLSRHQQQFCLRCSRIKTNRITAGPPTMSDVSRILQQIESGDALAAERLLPLVYDELRKLAAARLNQEKSGQTLQATALVHEAYLRLIGQDGDAAFPSRQHFFAAAAEAMRQDSGRSGTSQVSGSSRRRVAPSPRTQRRSCG